MTNLWIIFITGLTVGGLTCLAVQGGLLASVISERKNTLFATISFLISKLIAYTFLGFLLGAFGGAINISNTVQALMQLAAGVYMLAIALNLLNLHPIFRYAIIQPPRFLARLVKNQSRSGDIFAPAILGAMTIFIPCGTTLAIEALAISSANALGGASIMAVFILGTMPLFFGIGAVTSFFGEAFKLKFFKLAAVAIIYLGITSIYGSLVALDLPISIELSDQSVSTTQNPEIEITSSGYSPNYIRVKKDLPVSLRLKSKDAFSCASAFRIPALNISQNLKPNDIQMIAFTPTKVGKLQFNCSMGMYRGVIEVI